MALAFGTSVLDGRRTKVCTVTCLDNDAAADLAVAFLANGMTDMQGAAVPLAYGWTLTTSTDFALLFAITAVAATGFTIRKLTAAGAGGAVTVRCWFRNHRGIAS